VPTLTERSAALIFVFEFSAHFPSLFSRRREHSLITLKESILMIIRRSLVLRTAQAFLVTFGFGLSAVQAEFENLYTKGHADIAIHFEPGATELELGYELGSNAVINGVPVGVTTEVAANYLTAIVPNAPYARFDGGVAGLPGTFGSDTFWFISQPNPGAGPEVPWIGIGAEEIETGVFVGDTLGFRLKSVVAAPAGSEFIIYRSSLGVFDVSIDTQNLATYNALSVPAGGHRHFYFGFSEPGEYRLEFEASGTLIGGDAVTGSAVYAFTVVPEPSAWVSMSMALVSIGFARRYRKMRAAQV
jgi:surface-anchored protein